MLKRDITYTTFDGDQVTETYYFNVMKSELIELNVSQDGGMDDFIKRIVAAEDHKSIIAEFKKIILLAYGKKSPDGKRFIKSDELREEFSQTLAFDALFMELATNDDAGATFIQGVLPKDMQQDISKANLQSQVAAALPTPQAFPAPGVSE